MNKLCIYCENIEECTRMIEEDNICYDFSSELDFANDKYLELFIEERRVAFRNDWYAYVQNNE